MLRQITGKISDKRPLLGERVIFYRDFTLFKRQKPRNF